MIEGNYLDHPVWGQLSKADELLERDQHNEFSLSLMKLFQYFRWILDSSDPAFIAPQELNALNKELANALSTLTGAEINRATYDQCFQHLTPSLAKFPYPRIKRIFRSEANDALNKIEADSLLVHDKLDELQLIAKEAIEKAGSARDSAASTQKELEQTQSKILALIDQLQAQNSENLSHLVAEFRTEFTNEKNSRSERFQEEINILRDEVSSLKSEISGLESKADREFGNIREQQEERLADYQKMAAAKYTEIDKLYQEAGQTVLAGGFAQAAVAEKVRYESDAKWAKRSFGIAASVLGLLALTDLVRGEFTWIEAVYKLPISLVLAAPGVYFAGLASKHRKESYRLRSLGLRIGAFDAFVRSVKDDEATRLRANVSQHFFADVERPNLDEGGDLISDRFLEAFGKIADKLPSVGK